MPFIHVKSLPFDPPPEISKILEGITQDFAEETGIAIEHITATWEYFEPGHYSVAGKAATRQSLKTHPILVDLLIPEFNDAKMVKKMLNVLANSLARHTEVLRENIFINTRKAYAGSVFDAGDIVEW